MNSGHSVPRCNLGDQLWIFLTAEDLIGQKRPLKPKYVWTIRPPPVGGRRRDLAMFNLAIDSKLSGCDLVRLTADDA